MKKKLSLVVAVVLVLALGFATLALASQERRPVDASNDYILFASLSDTAEVLYQSEVDGMYLFVIYHGTASVETGLVKNCDPSAFCCNSNAYDIFGARIEQPQYIDITIMTREYWSVNPLSSGCTPGQHRGPIQIISQFSVATCMGPIWHHPRPCPIQVNTIWVCNAPNCNTRGSEQSSGGVHLCSGLF